MKPLISVIIPVYNGEQYLAEAIESVLHQIYQPIEIIVVDDGSFDHSANITKQFPSVKYFYQKNKGLGAARNLGIYQAKGQYLAFLDHDDLWEQNKLNKQMMLYLKQSNDPLIFGLVKQFYCPSLDSEQINRLKTDLKIQPGYFAGTLLISKQRFQAIGPFFEDKQVGEFADWYLRAIELNCPISLVDEVVMHRRIHLNNMGRQHNHYSRQAYLKILKASLDRRRKR